jgi:hypothetical protein
MSNSPRWRTTLENRKYQCHSCFCLMGVHSQCLNTNCEVYKGTLSPDKPYVHTYGGIETRPLAT